MADPFPAVGESVQQRVHDAVFLANKNEFDDPIPNTEDLCIVSGGGDEVVPHVATEPNSNNSSGQQLVPHVVVNVPNIEVSNNSGPQLVRHVATKVTIVLEVPNNDSSGQQDGNSNSELKPGALFAIGDCVTSIAAIVSNPPSSGDPVYVVAVGIVFTAGVLALLATLWVSLDAHKRRTAKQKIMYASVAPFILGLVLNVYAHKVKK